MKPLHIDESYTHLSRLLVERYGEGQSIPSGRSYNGSQIILVKDAYYEGDHVLLGRFPTTNFDHAVDVTVELSLRTTYTLPELERLYHTYVTGVTRLVDLIISQQEVTSSLYIEHTALYEHGGNTYTHLTVKTSPPTPPTSYYELEGELYKVHTEMVKLG